MRHLLIALLSLFVVVIPPAKAQTRAEGEAVRTLPQAFSDAWAKHDGHELAKMMAGDDDLGRGKAGRQLVRRCRSEHQRHSRYTARTARH
jgi:hypothetical protein